jgi:PAS domain S-box-containing protein
VQALHADVQVALAAIEDPKRGDHAASAHAGDVRRTADAAGEEHVNAVFKELLGLAARSGGTRPTARHVETPTPTPAPAQREARPGFDDDAQPLAVIGLDGRFRELNPSFARLVGYQEHQFAKATWPSPHDRQHYAQQQQQLAELASGGLERVAVQSTYMHGQGLMVPVIGEITVMKGADGTPSYLLLRAEERERTG